MNRRQFLSLASILVPVRRSAGLGSSLEVISGPVNGVIVTQRGRKLAIYGDPRPTPAVVDQVLLTHSRRDVCWAACGPDVLIPARGPLIDQPVAAIERLIERVKVVLREHFKTDALRWYFGIDNLRLRARKLLEGDVPTWMPMAIQRELPPWLLVIGNSRLLVSDTGSAFLVDCGFDTVIEELKRLRAQGRYQALEGIFITHYHDDHTDRAELCAEQFQCPIYFSPELKEVLENPRAYRMPCLSPYPIRRGKPMSQGAVLHWHEFELMFSYFPGQTLLHDSLLVKRTGGETVLFVGDSFTPSGLDDYCLWNRNFLASRSGFLHCLEDLQKLPPDHLLVNQHVEPAFRFSSEQLAFMIQSLQRRAEAMEQLFPWPNVNYGIDEQWVRLMPYECSTTPGKPFEIRSVIWNHLLKEQEYRVRPVLPEGWSSDQNEYQLRVPAQSEGAVSMRITPGTHSQDLAIILVDVDFGPWQLRQWSEAIVKLI